MGVTGLWSILQPCARPTKVETLNRKRLAVDASIWIYQFLKAVRDKEGNALRNSHVVGFFRRICKLLFFGIKPVFVFDGGAPALKRTVIRDRKRRREGRREDAARTAGKLLAVQMQRLAEEEDQRRREDGDRPPPVEEEAIPDELVYVEELQMSAQERRQQRTGFKKKDQYHLPDLDMSMNEMGSPNDPRIMSLEELQSYARQFDTGEDINVYDFSKIDYDSPFFTSLPASDRYNILNAARLRSRLRMGHSKEQLDTMFPDRMAFSKFQIERVTERNELTQRLMNINDPNGEMAFGLNGIGRVAGEKGREYVLVKNDGVEGGWALGVVSNEGRSAKEAIDIDESAAPVQPKPDSDEDDEFEDVAIEGLNRLPRRQVTEANAEVDPFARQRQKFYGSRKKAAKRRPKRAAPDDASSLFVTEQPDSEGDEEEWEEVDGNAGLFEEEASQADENEELQRAIALSLQQEDDAQENAIQQDEHLEQASESEADDMLEVFRQSAVEEAKPVPKGSGRAIANIVNRRAFTAAPDSHETTSFGVPVPKPDDSDEEDEAMDLQAALVESRRTKRKTTPPGPKFNNVAPHTPNKSQSKKPNAAPDIAKAHGFSGPLPFEKLDLGSSLLGKKVMQQRTEEAAGGFENPELAEKEKKKSAEPLPPWFSGNLSEDIERQRAIEDEDRRQNRDFRKQYQFESIAGHGIGKGDNNQIIDLDADDDRGFKNGEVVDLEAGDDDLDAHSDMSVTVEQDQPKLGDMADKLRADPATSVGDDYRNASAPTKPAAVPFEDYDSEEEQPKGNTIEEAVEQLPSETHNEQMADEDEEIEWSESDIEGEKTVPKVQDLGSQPAGGTLKPSSRSPSADFEDVAIPDRPRTPDESTIIEDNQPATDKESPAHTSGLVKQESVPEEDFDDFSDPEDEEILRALAQEAEEHARFASTLNNKTAQQNIADYERELKQLRNQQKKDRRDADEVTHIMITECQQLLRLFGLPYVTAPMEAEAQCAELVKLGLVDGIVTDDSDCFLFGGTRIYKNFFNQAKFVECYLSSDLEKEFDLTREKLIQVAQLLGSDYTEGLANVGPVSALEIISEFPSLSDFKDWWTGVQMQSIPKSADAGNAFRKKFRRNATKLFLPPNFPDVRVDTAYLDPDVDASPEPFQWGVPDLDALRSFLMATIGWSQERTDEVLVPVIRDMNRRMDEGTQANITAFFEGGVGAGAAGRGQGGEAFAPRRKADNTSKRMGSALNRMAERAKVRREESRTQDGTGTGTDGDVSTASVDKTAADDASNVSKPTRKRKPVRRARFEDDNDSDDGSEFEATRKKSKKRAGPRKAASGRADQ